MRETIAGFKRFVERYKFVLAVAALMGGPTLITLGTAVWYYDGVIAEVKQEHRIEVMRYQAETDFERETNRAILQGMQDYMLMIVERMGITAGKVEDAASKAEDAATSAAKAAASLPEPPKPETQP